MTLHAQEYPRAGDTLYSGRLDNGLAVYVVPRPGFRKKQAMLSVNYGGAMRSFSLSGGRVDTPAGVAHFLEHKMFDLPDGQRLHLRGLDCVLLRVRRRLLRQPLAANKIRDHAVLHRRERRQGAGHHWPGDTHDRGRPPLHPVQLHHGGPL